MTSLPSMPNPARRTAPTFLVEVRRLLAALCLLAGGLPSVSVRAEWTVQTLSLRSGWNAVFLHVDVPQATLSDLIGTQPNHPIAAIWQWQPTTASDQFAESPQTPVDTGSQWRFWSHDLGPASSLQRLEANRAYLVQIRADVPSYTWELIGRPVPPRYDWTTSGLNFVGFPTVEPVPRDVEAFLEPGPEALRSAEIYRYPGGPLGAGNPARLFAFRGTPLVRGQAFWMRAGTYFNRYFGPFEVVLQAGDGPDFGRQGGQYRIVLRNLTGGPLAVTLKSTPSHLRVPAGQPEVHGPLPLLVRGPLDTATAGYRALTLTDAGHAVSLAPAGGLGAQAEIVLGLDRSLLSSVVGQRFASVLQLSDSLGHTRIDLPASAEVASRAGLWIGEATLKEVRRYLRRGDEPFEDVPASARFRMRLIVHVDAANKVRLLQRAFVGPGREPGSTVVSTEEAALDPTQRSRARRISAVHLPWTPRHEGWPLDGSFVPGGAVSGEVFQDHREQASNPFLHTYHPDHDNLGSNFKDLVARGEESWDVKRRIELKPEAPPSGDQADPVDFVSRTVGAGSLRGEYHERMEILGQGSELRLFEVRGSFVLGRVSEIATLTAPPPAP